MERNNVKLSFNFFYFAILLYFNSCINMDSHYCKKYISFKPKIGTTFKFCVNEFKVVQDFFGESNLKKNEFKFSRNLNLLYSIGTEIPSKNIKATITIKEFDQKSIYNDDQSVDLEKLSNLSPFQKGLRAFDGAIFNLTVDSLGKITSLEGYDKFKSKFDSLYNDGSDKKNPDLWVMFMKEYFIEYFERISTVLPDTGVCVGSSWIKHESAINSDPVKITTMYRLEDIKGDIVYISTSIDVQHELAAPKATRILKGHGQGLIELDRETGMLIRAENTIEVHGNSLLGRINMGTHIKYKTEIIGELL